MITGIDIILKTNQPHFLFELAVSVLRKMWNGCTILDANENKKVNQFNEMPKDLPNEIFIFKNPDCIFVENEMVHLLLGDDQITVVVDDVENQDSKQLLQILKQNCFGFFK